nr:uncharacterized protein LOC117468276 isoform X2 [Pseudochaenichthys georgianus]
MRSGSPATKARYPRPRSSPNARKTLFHDALIEDLQSHIEQAGNSQEKRLIINLMTGGIVKKYRLQKYAQSTFGFTQRRWKTVGGNPYSFARKKCVRMEEEYKNKIRAFYTRDDVSRITTGKKQTLTHAKVKMQQRLLMDTLHNLHKKYLAENSRKSVSYSLFCRLRPYWVVHPSLSDRETCLCKLHENLSFVAEKLCSLKLLNTPELETLMAQICCDKTSKKCMYNDCVDCKEKDFPFIGVYEACARVACMQWVTEDTKGQDKNNIQTTFKKTVKKMVEMTLNDLINLFTTMLVKCKRHTFNIRQQYKYCRELKRNMSENECIIHVDFSENYTCTYASEIQAVHFVASRSKRHCTLEFYM